MRFSGSVPTWRKWLGLALCAVAIPYAVWSFSQLETQGLYHPQALYPNNDPYWLYGLAYGKRAEEVRFAAADGTRLHGVYIAPAKGRETILYAHGNGGHIGTRLTTVKSFTDRGFGVLAFDYRGYGKSEGSPAEPGLYQDMAAASRYLSDKRETPVGRQVALGESLGSAVAVEAATHQQFRAVFLFSALTTTPDVASYLLKTHAWGVFQFLPTRWIMRQQYDSLSRMEKITEPLLVVHGGKDKMMPVSMGRALYEKAGSRYRKFILLPGSDHNSIFFDAGPQLVAALEALLRESDRES